MYVPRRHSRRLLLPPGWVALGFLLLLGCQALLAHRRKLRLPNVIQLHMPPLKPNKDENWSVPVYGSRTELNNFRPWRDAEFVGTQVRDFINMASVEQAMKAMRADTSEAGGVRVRFGPHATYSTLVEVLDMMNRLNQEIYWLDIHHQPTTFYAITHKPRVLPFYSDVISGERYFYTTELESNGLVFRQQLVNLLQKLRSLRQGVWQPSILLLVIISCLNIYRLLSHAPSPANPPPAHPVLISSLLIQHGRTTN